MGRRLPSVGEMVSALKWARETKKESSSLWALGNGITASKLKWAGWNKGLLSEKKV